jgi:16S rRNA (adenine1518-N6/adenine1519-N6)-dimethyltransferase
VVEKGENVNSRKERIYQKVVARLEQLNAGGPKRSLGQNFLISDHVIDKIIFAVKAEPFSEMIEVGPGLGALTEDLVDLARASEKRLTLIELDQTFAAEWRARIEDVSRWANEGGDVTVGRVNLRVIEADALQIDWNELGLSPKTVFVSNLPYQISSSIAIERSIEPAGVTRMILMFQKEVAQRIGARAKTPDYGLLTVIIQAFWETATVVDAGPKDFHPAPNVASRVVVFRRRDEPDFGSGSRQGFLRFAKAAFAHRRKLLTKNLAGEPNASRLEEAFSAMKLLPTARAEELTPPQFIELYRRLNS